MWKTLAQFHLLGDPSLHPVEGERPERHRAVGAAVVRAQEPSAAGASASTRREVRRRSSTRGGLPDDEVLPERLEEFLAAGGAMGATSSCAPYAVAGLEKVSQGDPSLAAWRQANQVVMMVEAYVVRLARAARRHAVPAPHPRPAHYRMAGASRRERLVSR